MTRDTHITHSAEETKTYAKELAKQFQPGTIVALHGELGAGKTTFVQGIAEGLGITGKIISPTFILIREYEISSQFIVHSSRLRKLYHIDLYRLEAESNLQELGLKEIFEMRDSLVLVEWAEKAKELLPQHTQHVYLRYIDEDQREIRIEKPNSQ